MLKKHWALVLFALTQAACSGTDEVTTAPRPGGTEEVSLTPLVQTQHCPITQPGLNVYQSPEVFAQALEATRAPKNTLDLVNDKHDDADAQMTIEPGTWAVAVNLGQKPSAGYGLELESRTGQLKDGTLTINLKQTQPSPGGMQATVITMPCVIVSFAGSMHNIKEVKVKTEEQRWQQSVAHSSQKK